MRIEFAASQPQNSRAIIALSMVFSCAAFLNGQVRSATASIPVEYRTTSGCRRADAY